MNEMNISKNDLVCISNDDGDSYETCSVGEVKMFYEEVHLDVVKTLRKTKKKTTNWAIVDWYSR